MPEPVHKVGDGGTNPPETCEQITEQMGQIEKEIITTHPTGAELVALLEQYVFLADKYRSEGCGARFTLPRPL